MGLTDRCLSPTPSGLNDPSIQDHFRGRVLFQSAQAREARNGHPQLFKQMTVDHDEWLLTHLEAAKSDSHAVARACTNIEPGAYQHKLLSFYAHDE